MDFMIYSCVLQGSYLGRALFLIFINDEIFGLDVFISLFADDLKIAVAVNSITTAMVCTLQLAIYEVNFCVFQWMILSINVQLCQLATSKENFLFKICVIEPADNRHSAKFH